ncbi:MAG: hypothetical protein J5781_03875 [Clostridia bacterium]|nr:hypothetical protein [Clostridia bacterium]
MNTQTTKKAVYAVIMLLIAAMLVGTTTYAWFSMNKTVTVTGMVVKVRATENIMIAEDNAEDDFAYGLDQTRAGNLRPSSSVNGIDYYYAEKVNGNGSAAGNYLAYDESTGETLNNVAAAKSKYVADYNTKYGVVTPVTADNAVYAYIDYSFYIKATNPADDDKTLLMSRCSLMYNYAYVSYDTDAWRIAVFAKETQKETSVNDSAILSTANNNATLVTILADDGAHYYNEESQNVKAVGPNGTLENVLNYKSYADIGVVPAGATKYYRVVVRMWLEGEDSTCTVDTFAALTKDWSLDLMFEFDKEVTTEDNVTFSLAHGVSGIGTGTSVYLNVSLSNYARGEGAMRIEVGNRYENISSYQWYKEVSDGEDVVADTYGTGAQTQNFTANTTGYYYYVAVSEKGSKYRSKSVRLVIPTVTAVADEGEDPRAHVVVSDVKEGTTIAYRWCLEGYDGNALSSQTGNELRYCPLNGNYYCKVTIHGVEYTTNSVTLEASH